ncbi:DUF262 domain-containing protein [Brachyspira innocens]|uniref:DUF262 domain-containing protein n=1 Tax=Brachyspira innocens TaxID=13264 RepID=UPI0026ED4CB0|nr:DUF262 domain-containing protein [Brachyspira innocens]
MNDKLSLIDFFKKYSRIEIPKIQRDYAQGRENESEVANRFLDKIFECLKYGTDLELDFIYGSVDKVDKVDKNVVYLLDGQQRVTTLFLLYWYIALKEDKYKEIECLTKFTYSTRVSSREFCQNIINHIKNIKDEISKKENDKKKKLSVIIKDFYWFTNENDPTIKAMLNMIGKIDEKYNEITKDNNSIKLFDNLEKIKFYFLPLEDFKLTDEIYLKMNARGKPLTSFENFKALLEDFFKDKIDKGILQQYKIKIDTSWVNFIWTLNKDCKKVDDLFMKLFRFIFEMLYYSQIEIISKVEDIKKLEIEESSLDFFELFFSHIYDNEKKEYLNKLKENSIKNEKDQLNKNINFIINIFDILSSLGKCKLETLFNDIFYYNNESENDEDKYNKICTFNNNLNVFNNNNDNLFDFLTNIEKRILIFSVFKILNYEYLKNKENIKDIDNIKNKYFNKLRLIRNLLYNTDNLYGNIYYQMKLIDKIITEDEITVMEDQLSGQEKRIKNILFTDKLVESEKNKLTILENTDENTRKRIYACENNVFLQGNIDFLLDNIDNENIVNVVNYIFTKDGFNKENNYLVHRAISIYIKDNFILFKYINNQRTLINDNKYKKNKCLSNFINDLLVNIKNDQVVDYIRSLTNMINEFSDEDDFRFYIIKELQYEDSNKNIIRTSLYDNNYIKDNSSIDSQYIYYYNNRESCWDIALSDKIYTIFNSFKYNIAKEFELYYFYYPYKKGEYYNEKLDDCSRMLRYEDKKLLYCYQWVTLAKEIENEKVLVGFTTNGYCLECGLRKKIPYRDENRTENILTKIEEKKINFEGYERWTNNIHWDYHWYYYKYFNTCDNISLLDNEYKILKPVIDAFLQNK